jgi:hypothetical protein
MPSDSKSGPLFVVGMWRSGTSLLYALLNQHPQIALMYEGDLPLFWPFFLLPGGKSNWLARWDFWYAAARRHGLDVSKVPNNIADPRAAAEAICTEYARQKGAAIWGDKSPNYYDSLPRLLRDFPAASFIIIWRNPAGICRSILRAAEESPWFAKKGMILRALLGCRELKRGCDQLVANGAPVHQIQYEELIRNPEGAMRRVCEFLRVPFDPRMASLEDADRSAIANGEHHALVKGRSIVSSAERSEVLSELLKKKIDRYNRLWREEYGGSWPALAHPEQLGSERPSFLERLSDRILYRSLRAWDRTVVFIYGLAPLRLLKGYRAFKQQYAKSEKLPSYQ